MTAAPALGATVGTVSELGDFLELMQGARSHFRSARALVRQWQRVGLRRRAFERWAEEEGATLYAAARDPRGPTETAEARTRLWVESWSRFREEHEGDLGGARVGIRDGQQWWMYSPDVGAITNEGDPLRESGIGQLAEQMLDPAPLLAILDFELRPEAEVAARRAFRAVGLPRRRLRRLPGPGLPEGADEHELLVDAERGALLRIASRVDGQEFAVTEMIEVTFDETFPPETFVFVPPPGEDLRPV
jgi:outer membrane lipoprotein-sorting protein